MLVLLIPLAMSGSPDRSPDLVQALFLKASAPVLKEYRVLLSLLSDVNAEVDRRGASVLSRNPRTPVILDCQIAWLGGKNISWRV